MDVRETNYVKKKQEKQNGSLLQTIQNNNQIQTQQSINNVHTYCGIRFLSIPIVESGSMCSTFSAFKFFNRFCNQEIK